MASGVISYNYYYGLSSKISVEIRRAVRPVNLQDRNGAISVHWPVTCVGRWRFWLVFQRRLDNDYPDWGLCRYSSVLPGKWTRIMPRVLPTASFHFIIHYPTIWLCAGELLAAPFNVCSTNSDYRDKYSEVPVNVAQRYGREQGCPGDSLDEPQEAFHRQARSVQSKVCAALGKSPWRRCLDGMKTWLCETECGGL